MVKVLSHVRRPEVTIKNIENWAISTDEKKHVKKYVELYESGSITGRLPTNPDALIERILQLLRPFLENIKEPSQESCEKFKTNLLKDKILSFNKKTKKYNGKPYSLKTKKGIFEAGLKYFEWRYPDKPEIVKPIKIKISIKENDDYQTFTIPDQADKLRANCDSVKKRGIFSALMSGARIEEIMNWTEQDINLDGNFPMVTIKNNMSKTKGRKIQIIYDHAKIDLYEYIKERKAEGMKPNDPLFNIRYLSLMEFLGRLGKNTLNMRLTAHTFRHSVATFLATKYNRAEFCYYFGWAYSSRSPDRYINREGIVMKGAEEKIENESIQGLKQLVTKQQFENKLIQDTMKKNELDYESKFVKLQNDLKEKKYTMEETREELLELKNILNQVFRQMKKQNYKVKIPPYYHLDFNDS